MSTQKVTTALQLLRDAEEKVATARRLLQDISGQPLEGATERVVLSADESTATNIIEGIFDGQSMIGSDKKVYPVPANYASKSKLVEGDTLKLTIVDDGSFIYKQIGPIDRKHVRGQLSRDERGEYRAKADGAEYRVLLASVTYFKGIPGDEVTLMLPKSGIATWGAIENIIKTTDEQQLPELVRESMERLREGDTGNTADVGENYDPAEAKKIPISESNQKIGEKVAE